MGMYINVINGKQAPDLGKVDFIINNIPGTCIIDKPTQWQEGLVCVVENNTAWGHFEAAGYAYDENEMQVFLRPDSLVQRPRTWLIVPNAKQYAK